MIRRSLQVTRVSTNPRRFPWPEALARLLGTVPDQELAERAGVSLTTVVVERQRRGIPAFVRRRGPIEWTEAMLSLLGTDTDANVAAELGITKNSVFQRRRLLGISSFTGGPSGARGFVWSKRALALLGTASDAMVARKLGLTPTTVGTKRRVLEIPSHHDPIRPTSWSSGMIKLLGKVADREVSRLLGVNAVTVQRKRKELGIAPSVSKQWIARTRDLERILKLPRKEICQKYGLPGETVRLLRRQLGIVAPQSLARHRWTRAELARLGKEPDCRLASSLGLYEATVARERKRRGIPVYPSKHWWTEAERALLGRKPDEEIAHRLGVSLGAVRTLRSRLRIAAPAARRRR